MPRGLRGQPEAGHQRKDFPLPLISSSETPGFCAPLGTHERPFWTSPGHSPLLQVPPSRLRLRNSLPQTGDLSLFERLLLCVSL